MPALCGVALSYFQYSIASLCLGFDAVTSVCERALESLKTLRLAVGNAFHRGVESVKLSNPISNQADRRCCCRMLQLQ